MIFFIAEIKQKDFTKKNKKNSFYDDGFCFRRNRALSPGL
jgi:hypothetical protein